MGNGSRNYGIDLLRIASMLGVVFLHVLGHGGLLSAEQAPSSFSTVWFFEALAYPAVNCFMLISGYVGYRGDKTSPRIKNIVSLWLTVLFYSVTIFFIFRFFGPETLGKEELKESLMPVIKGGYWFFTAYFGLFLVSPLLNLFVNKAELRQACAFLFVFCVLTLFSFKYDPFHLINGYTLMWFILIYCVGAIIKKYSLNKLFSKKIWFTVFLFTFIVAWLSKLICTYSDNPLWQSNSERLIRYVSPTIVIMAISLLCFFASSKISPTLAKSIAFISPSAFSVYLIHDNYYIRTHLIMKIHTVVPDSGALILALCVIGIVLGIFFSCILIDKVRTLLFKLIKIERLAVHTENFINTAIDFLYKKIGHRLTVKLKEE